jgi:hypothetical protein
MVNGTVHPDAVAAVKARIMATTILLVQRDIAVPPFVFQRSVARYGFTNARVAREARLYAVKPSEPKDLVAGDRREEPHQPR